MAKILVVDDEPAVRGSLKRAFGQETDEFLTASSGLEALALLNEESIDVAFIDIVMPGVDGITLMRRILEDHPGVRIVVMSGYKDVIDLAAREIGVVCSLMKPFTIDEARVALTMALGGAEEDRLA